MLRSEEDILEEVKKLAVEYYQLTGKPLGVTGEIAEFLAASAMGLELSSARTEGYDAVNSKGAKVQIKGRRLGPGGVWGRVPSINTNKEFDTVQLVLLDINYDLLEIWETDKATIIAILDAPGSKARNKRRSMSVSKFKQIGLRLYSAPHTPLESKKVCPECGHIFRGNGWSGIDAHWRAKHQEIMPYADVFASLKSGSYTRTV